MLQVYHVSSINVNRPTPPGKVGVTITTARGETIYVHDSVAIVNDPDGNQVHRITAPTPESGRRRRTQTGDEEVYAPGCPQQKITELENSFNEIGSLPINGTDDMIARFLESLSKELTAQEAEQMMSANDLDGNMIVERNEFVQAQCAKLLANSDPGCGLRCQDLFDRGLQTAGDECAASCFCSSLSPTMCQFESMCRPSGDASGCEPRPKTCDERCELI